MCVRLPPPPPRAPHPNESIHAAAPASSTCSFSHLLLCSCGIYKRICASFLSLVWIVPPNDKGIILPSLQQLHSNLVELDDSKVVTHGIGNSQEKVKGNCKFSNFEAEREDECRICLEPCNKMVLPNCCHAMCINCYRDWNTRSESCPFCRGNLKRVKSRDLWVLTCNDEVVDPETVSKEDLLHFYLYVNSLPKDSPDALFLMYYEYLI